MPAARLITFEGQTRSLTGWARHLGINQASLWERIDKFGVEISLSIKGPVQPFAIVGTKGHLHDSGYRVIKKAGKNKLEHTYFAERALGKKLPSGATVHHVNGDKSDNKTPWNLVVCPTMGYHMLLHQRSEAYDACGNANWRRCYICRSYDDPVNLVSEKRLIHKECFNAKEREAMRAIREIKKASR